MHEGRRRKLSGSADKRHFGPANLLITRIRFLIGSVFWHFVFRILLFGANDEVSWIIHTEFNNGFVVHKIICILLIMFFFVGYVFFSCGVNFQNKIDVIYSSITAEKCGRECASWDMAHLQAYEAREKSKSRSRSNTPTKIPCSDICVSIAHLELNSHRNSNRHDQPNQYWNLDWISHFCGLLSCVIRMLSQYS